MTAQSGPGGAPRRRCPMCGKETVERYRPFCSKRCADLDLGRWLGEHYRVAGPPASDNDLAESERDAAKGLDSRPPKR